MLEDCCDIGALVWPLEGLPRTERGMSMRRDALIVNPS